MTRSDLAHVLLVDDDPLLLSGMRRRLSSHYRVSTATSATDALRSLAADPPLVIITDLYMPGMDGTKLLEEVRRLHPEVVRMLFTGRADHSEAKGAVASGHIFRYLVKGSPGSVVVDAIADAVAFARANAATEAPAPAPAPKSRDELRRADRLARAGTLAASVGEELNDLAMPLMMVLPELRERAKGGEPLGEDDLQLLEFVAHHLRSHAANLQAFTRPRPDDRLGDLGEIVGEVAGLMRATGRTKRVEVALDLPREVVLVSDPTGLQQVILNLLDNAVDAASGQPGKSARIAVQIDAGESAVTCRVRDNGCGVAPTDLERIFDAFYTTKDAEQGTGLGLSVAREIVAAQGGRIWVESSIGVGATFAFSIPRVLPLQEMPPERRVANL